MQIKQRKMDQVVIVELSGEIDINTSPLVRKTFDQLIKQQEQKVLLNFSQVSYIDSSGLATLVEMLKRLRRFGGNLRLCNLSEKVKGLFEITKLDKLFQIFPEEEQALREF
ncbi:MAG: STAS domain-containing protein [Candidatus Omnitrophica bacterium]|nr:STAS domain-containing protein [Candidatus Omnitrophota bacterium]